MQKKHRVILIDVIEPHIHKNEALQNLTELKSLISTYNGIDIVTIIQHRNKPDKATYIGSGKMNELLDLVITKQVNLIVINDIVNPRILFNITEKLWNYKSDIQVWDRIDLILNIFDKHALTSEAKLQIEIAKMQHMGPRIYGLGGTYFSRQGGGIGTRGIGETNVELMKRHWRTQIKKKKEEINKLANQRETQMLRRKENGVKNISIVGYTNAGKTSLFNFLTKKNKVVKNELFVTLDAVTGKVYLENIKKEVTISDTIGFISDLPSSLVSAFKSTLLESVNSDLLLHVIDIADPEMEKKITVVENILIELKVDMNKVIYVFNKIDVYKGDSELVLKKIRNTYSAFTPQFISVTEKFGIDKLKQKVAQLL